MQSRLRMKSFRIRIIQEAKYAAVFHIDPRRQT